jgi:hypothetical protein
MTMLDNVFSILGGVGTAVVLLGIIALLTAPAVSAVLFPTGVLRRLQPSGH